jgi:hypothetical protein
VHEEVLSGASAIALMAEQVDLIAQSIHTPQMVVAAKALQWS